MDDYKRFHKLRRMFAIIKDTVLIAPGQFPLTHSEWLGSLGLGAYADTCTRGYYHAHTKVLAFYSGTTFDATTDDRRNFYDNLSVLLQGLNPLPDTAIWAGVQPQALPGSQWPPREVIGSVAKHLGQGHI